MRFLVMIAACGLMISAQSSLPPPLSVCDTAEAMYKLAGRMIVVEGTVGADGALRGDCAEPIIINGFKYPRAIWIKGEEGELSREIVAACPRCISMQRLAEEVYRVRSKPGGERIRIKFRLVGVLTILDTEQNRKTFQPGMPPAGYGRFGQYAILLTARAAERWSVVDK